MTCKSLASLSGFISIFLFCHIQMPLNGWWNCSWSSLDRPLLKVNTSCTGLAIKVNEAIKSMPFIMTIVSAHTPTPLSAKAINLCKVRFRHFIPAGNKNLIALYQCKSSQLWQLDAVRRPSKKKKGNVSVPLKKKKKILKCCCLERQLQPSPEPLDRLELPLCQCAGCEVGQCV